MVTEKLMFTLDEEKVSKEKLLPCPFCGCSEIEISYPKKNTIKIKCKRCVIQKTQRWRSQSKEWLLEEMIEAWNQRRQYE